LYFGPTPSRMRPPNPTGSPRESQIGNVGDVLARELLLLQMLAQHVVVVRRKAERELAGVVAIEAAAPQVFTGVSTLGRFEQQRVVERDRFPHRGAQSLLALAFDRERCVVVPQRDVGAPRESFDRFDEVEVLDLTDERDRVAALLATEAEIGAEFLVDGERRRLLRVEGAEALPPAPDALECDVLARERDEVGCFANPGDVLVENAHRASG